MNKHFLTYLFVCCFAGLGSISFVMLWTVDTLSFISENMWVLKVCIC